MESVNISLHHPGRTASRTRIRVGFRRAVPYLGSGACSPGRQAGLAQAVAALVLALLAAVGCRLPPGGSVGAGQLTVVNATSHVLDLVRWVDTEGVSHYFEPDIVYDEVLQREVGGMNRDSEATLEVPPGSSPVYFYLAAGGAELRTQEVVLVRSGDAVRFTLTDSTLVVDAAAYGDLQLCRSPAAQRLRRGEIITAPQFRFRCSTAEDNAIAGSAIMTAMREAQTSGS